jgi:hypothetical protein
MKFTATTQSLENYLMKQVDGIARVNGNKIKEDLADSDCPYECLIEIYIVSNQPDTSGSSFSSYKVVNSISSTINPTDENDRYYF